RREKRASPRRQGRSPAHRRRSGATCRRADPPCRGYPPRHREAGLQGETDSSRATRTSVTWRRNLMQSNAIRRRNIQAKLLEDIVWIEMKFSPSSEAQLFSDWPDSSRYRLEGRPNTVVTQLVLSPMNRTISPLRSWSSAVMT